MPRLYVSPQEVAQSAFGVGVASSLARLASGVVDAMLWRASQRCDTFCEKRLQAPGSSTLTATVSAGSTTLTVASTLTLDDLAELAVIIDVGNSNQETIEIVPGGVAVAGAPTGIVYPYPGTITLKSPLQFGHSNGAPVQYCYKEVGEAIKASQSDPYSEALQSQAAQLALAHLPAMHVGLTRIVFTKAYPIQTVYTVEHAYSFDTTYNLVYDNSNPTFTGGIILEPTAGFYRFRVGTVVTPEGMVRTTYSAGYTVIPDDIKRAVILYFTDDLQQMINPWRVKSEKQGKRTLEWEPKHSNIDEAERILKKYRRSV